MWVCLNVYSPFDQDVSLPNVTAAVEGWGVGGSSRPRDQSNQCVFKIKKKKSPYSREEWLTVMMLTRVWTLMSQRQAGWRWCLFYSKGGGGRY